MLPPDRGSRTTLKKEKHKLNSLFKAHHTYRNTCIQGTLSNKGKPRHTKAPVTNIHGMGEKKL